MGLVSSKARGEGFENRVVNAIPQNEVFSL